MKPTDLPGVALTQEAELVSVASPAHHLARHKDVQQAEAQEVQEQEDGRGVEGGPVKDGGLDEQEGNGDRC